MQKLQDLLKVSESNVHIRDTQVGGWSMLHANRVVPSKSSCIKVQGKPCISDLLTCSGSAWQIALLTDEKAHLQSVNKQRLCAMQVGGRLGG